MSTKFFRSVFTCTSCPVVSAADTTDFSHFSKHEIQRYLPLTSCAGVTHSRWATEKHPVSHHLQFWPAFTRERHWQQPRPTAAILGVDLLKSKPSLLYKLGAATRVPSPLEDAICEINVWLNVFVVICLPTLHTVLFCTICESNGRIATMMLDCWWVREGL